jgi:hypothetical protein
VLFFRIIRHLLPDGQAWRVTIDKTLRRFLLGVASVHASARDFIERVYDDRLPETTRDLAPWLAQFGIEPAATDADQRLQLASAWQATGGQSPAYLQSVVQAAGFPLYIFEFWWLGDVLDPRTFTDQPLTGTVQCGEPLAQCGEPSAQCNNFLVNDPHYLVNLALTRDAPPPIPSDPSTWVHFLYWGGPSGEFVDLPVERRPELERLLLKLKPSEKWIVTFVNWV